MQGCPPLLLPSLQAPSWPWQFGQPPPQWTVSRPPSPATWHCSPTPALLPSPASHHSPCPRRSSCLCPTHTRLGPSSLLQHPQLSSSPLGSLRGFPHHRAPGSPPSHILPGQHLDLCPLRSLFHSSIHTSFHPRLRESFPPSLLTPSQHHHPVSLHSHQLPCIPSSTLAPPRKACQPRQGLCPSLTQGLPSHLTHLWPMVPLRLPGPWAPRQPRSLCVALRPPASPAPVPIWCLHPPLPRDLAQCPLGPLQQIHLCAHAGAQRLQTCCPPAQRASTVVHSLLGVGSPCCSRPRWTQLMADAHRPCGS